MFCESDEEKEEHHQDEEVADFKPRSKNYVKDRKVFHPQEGHQGFSKVKPKENNRWKRWQELSRKTGEEEDLDDIAKFPSPENSPERETKYSNDPQGKEESVRPTSRLSNVSSTTSFSQQQQPKETSPQYEQQQHHKGIIVTVKTFENEEVGILARDNNLVILFNINQVTNEVKTVLL